MLSLSEISQKEQEDICGPRSKMILFEVPCKHHTLSRKSFTNPSESKVDVDFTMDPFLCFVVLFLSS